MSLRQAQPNAKPLVRIVLGSQSKDKINAVNSATKETKDEKYEDGNIILNPVKADSSVDEQPINDKTLLGARNRVEHAKKLDPSGDIYVAIENGIFEGGVSRELNVLSTLPDFKDPKVRDDYRSKYIVIKSPEGGYKLHYFNTLGKLEDVEVNDILLFQKSLETMMEGKDSKLLNGEQLKSLITSNSRHIIYNCGHTIYIDKAVVLVQVNNKEHIEYSEGVEVPFESFQKAKGKGFARKDGVVSKVMCDDGIVESRDDPHKSLGKRIPRAVLLADTLRKIDLKKICEEVSTIKGKASKALISQGLSAPPAVAKTNPPPALTPLNSAPANK